MFTILYCCLWFINMHIFYEYIWKMVYSVLDVMRNFHKRTAKLPNFLPHLFQFSKVYGNMRQATLITFTSESRFAGSAGIVCSTVLVSTLTTPTGIPPRLYKNTVIVTKCKATTVTCLLQRLPSVWPLRRRNATSLVYWLPTCMGRLRRDGQCCGREAQCGQWPKINWTKTAHRMHGRRHPSTRTQ